MGSYSKLLKWFFSFNHFTVSCIQSAIREKKKKIKQIQPMHSNFQNKFWITINGLFSIQFKFPFLSDLCLCIHFSCIWQLEYFRENKMGLLIGSRSIKCLNEHFQKKSNNKTCETSSHFEKYLSVNIWIPLYDYFVSFIAVCEIKKIDFWTLDYIPAFHRTTDAAAAVVEKIITALYFRFVERTMKQRDLGSFRMFTAKGIYTITITNTKTNANKVENR